MDIGKAPSSALVPTEWKVCVCVSVMTHVPRDVLAAWMAVESYADASGRCWPDNRTLLARMGVGSKRSAQRALLKLEEYGIVRRDDQGGNRRTLTLLRRTSTPITATEWASLSERGEARTEQRAGRLDAPIKGLDWG